MKLAFFGLFVLFITRTITIEITKIKNENIMNFTFKTETIKSHNNELKHLEKSNDFSFEFNKEKLSQNKFIKFNILNLSSNPHFFLSKKESLIENESKDNNRSTNKIITINNRNVSSDKINLVKNITKPSKLHIDFFFRKETLKGDQFHAMVTNKEEKMQKVIRENSESLSNTHSIKINQSVLNNLNKDIKTNEIKTNLTKENNSEKIKIEELFRKNHEEKKEERKDQITPNRISHEEKKENTINFNFHILKTTLKKNEFHPLFNPRVENEKNKNNSSEEKNSEKVVITNNFLNNPFSLDKIKSNDIGVKLKEETNISKILKENENQKENIKNNEKNQINKEANISASDKESISNLKQENKNPVKIQENNVIEINKGKISSNLKNESMSNISVNLLKQTIQTVKSIPKRVEKDEKNEKKIEKSDENKTIINEKKSEKIQKSYEIKINESVPGNKNNLLIKSQSATEKSKKNIDEKQSNYENSKEKKSSNLRGSKPSDKIERFPIEFSLKKDGLSSGFFDKKIDEIISFLNESKKKTQNILKKENKKSSIDFNLREQELHLEEMKNNKEFLRVFFGLNKNQLKLSSSKQEKEDVGIIPALESPQKNSTNSSRNTDFKSNMTNDVNSLKNKSRSINETEIIDISNNTTSGEIQNNLTDINNDTQIEINNTQEDLNKTEIHNDPDKISINIQPVLTPINSIINIVPSVPVFPVVETIISPAVALPQLNGDVISINITQEPVKEEHSTNNHQETKENQEKVDKEEKQSENPRQNNNENPTENKPEQEHEKLEKKEEEPSDKEIVVNASDGDARLADFQEKLRIYRVRHLEDYLTISKELELEY